VTGLKPFAFGIRELITVVRISEFFEITHNIKCNGSGFYEAKPFGQFLQNIWRSFADSSSENCRSLTTHSGVNLVFIKLRFLKCKNFAAATSNKTFPPVTMLPKFCVYFAQLEEQLKNNP